MISGLVVCAVVVVAVLVWPRHEPCYGGRYLSVWLRDCYVYDRDDPRCIRAEEAVRRIGTNALPWLLENLRCDRPQWMCRVAQVAEKVPGPFNSWWASVIAAHDPGRQAARGFFILGLEAEPAISGLAALMDDRYVADPAVGILGSMGRVALPEVLRVLTNRTTEVHRRAAAAWAIQEMGTNASDTIGVLEKCLDDDPEVAGCAAWALSAVALDTRLVIAPLTNALRSSSAEVRRDVTDVLGSLGEAGRPAAAAIAALLVDCNEDVRVVATNALADVLGTEPEPGSCGVGK